MPKDLHERVLIPELDKHQLARDHNLRPERVEDLLDHYREFAYASREHVILELLFNVGCRVGALHGVDLSDYHPDEQFLEFVHREPETPLKHHRGLSACEPPRRVGRPGASPAHRHDARPDEYLGDAGHRLSDDPAL